MLRLFTVSGFFVIRVLLFFFQGNFSIFIPIKKKFFDTILIFDWIRILFARILLLISARVLIFSSSYMKKKPFQTRFFWIVICFIIRMLFIIIFPMRIFMLIGWDGLGLFSFLLVRFYKASSRWSARMKTFLTKRIGDSFFIIFFSLRIIKDFWFKKKISSFLLWIVFILACFTKRAQVPFRRWLPAAMAAPTPVSSLVHSSTLVTAGIYLIIRRKIREILRVIRVIGVITAIIAAFSAIKEFDSKKIVALSTLSNLGIMVFAFSSGIFIERFFHLITHAVSKANLFIRVGWLMLKKNHHQDLRFLNGKIFLNFVLNLKIRIRIWRLSGLTFFSGYFSKDKIIELYRRSFRNVFFWGRFYLIVILRFIYRFRLLILLSSPKSVFKNITFSKKKISFSYIWLCLFSIILGVLVNKLFFIKRFLFNLKKFIILRFITIALVYVFYFCFFQKVFFKELLYINFIGGSLRLKFSKNREILYNLFKKKIFKQTQNNIQKITEKIFSFLKKKRLNLSFWCLILLLVILF